MENQKDTQINDGCEPIPTNEVCWPQDNTGNELKRHTVTFEFTDLGCIIQVGCKKFCFSDNNKALVEFDKYVKNPKEAYETWNK